jgi:DNA primase
MASNARPLWQLLPEGALKRQLLGEIAAQVKMQSQELAELWAVTPGSQRKPEAAPRQGAPQRRDSYSGGEKTGRRSTRRLPVRPSIEASASNIARLVFRTPAFWDQLTTADHEVLCELEGPFGDLFRWFDAQIHEHGAQPLAALMAGMVGQEFEPLARGIVEIDNLQPLGRLVEDAETPFSTLRMVVINLRRDVIDLELRQIQTLAPGDPARKTREEQLILQQFALKKEAARP